MAKSTAEEKLAVRFQKCVGDLWGGDDFSDFNVVVEGTTYRCHRFILAACSRFFQGLFRSNMKECQESSVKIEGIDQETFRVVLHSMYRGAGGITPDNFLDVWRALEQLQIGFLTDECQRFATNNLSVENCFKVLDCAKIFVSEDVVKQALKFIAEKFDDVYNTVDIMQMSFNDFYNVINSDLLFTAREDLVLETVINWLSYVDSLSETVNRQNEFKLFYEILNKSPHVDGNNHISGVKSLYSNNNVSTSLQCPESFQENNTEIPEQMYSNVEPVSRKERIPVNDFIEVSPLACLSNYISAGAGENHVAPPRKRSHSQAGLDDDRESGDGPQSNIHQSDRRQHLVALVGACRLCLVSSKYLEKVLETNQMISSCPETRQMLLRALVYTLDVGRRHDCWPDQAVRRVNSHWTYVMIFWHNNSLKTYDLRTGGGQKIGQNSSLSCSSMHLVVFDNSLYSFHRRYYGRESSCIVGEFTKESGFTSNIDYPFLNAMMLAHDGCIYFLAKASNSESLLMKEKVRIYQSALSDNFRSFHVDANCLVRFNQYILVFHTANDVLIAECYDTKEGTIKELPAKMEGTSEGMKSFTYRGDVYLLQTNGSLWNIVDSGKVHSIEFELVTRLWDDNIIILGLAVFQSKLHLFVNDDSVRNANFSEYLPTSLIQIVRIPLALTTEMVPMVVPSDWLQD